MAEVLMKETVRVDSEGFPDGLVINKSDFDPEVHVLFGTKAPKHDDARGATVNVQVTGATVNAQR